MSGPTSRVRRIGGCFGLMLVSLTHAPSFAADGEGTPAEASGAFTPSPLYAALFAEGREWMFRVESVAEYMDEPDNPRARARLVRDAKVTKATCRVTKVVRWTAAVGSRVECTGALSSTRIADAIPAVGGLLAGDWVATSTGLWQSSEPVVDGPEPALPAQDRVIAANPRESTKKDTRENGGTFEEVRRQGTTWCSTRTSWGGDESGNVFCWSRSAGPKAGRWFFSGGEYLEVSFCREPSSCRMLSKKPVKRAGAGGARR